MERTRHQSRRRVETEKKKEELVDTERKFRKSCDQILILNRQMDAIQKRYANAKHHNVRIFRYKLRLRLAVVEGLRNVYYEYASQKANEIVALRRDLFGEIVEVVTDSDVEDGEVRDQPME